MTKKVLSGPFVVKIAGQVQEVMPGVTCFKSMRVLERLPATISSRGKIKALWRSRCDLCSREVVKDLGKGPPQCRCIDCAGDQKHKYQVLSILSASKTFISFRTIMTRAARIGVKNEPALRILLQELLAEGRVKLARDEQTRGYAFVPGLELATTKAELIVDQCRYDEND